MGKSFQIPDYELVIEIAQGSYGQVWLAQSVLGSWRAVKDCAAVALRRFAALPTGAEWHPALRGNFPRT